MKTDVSEHVDRQLAAYNNHDVEAFVATYSEDIKIYDFPNELICEGKDVLREMYKGIFERAPNINAELTDRVVIQNKVIDKEFVTNRAGKDNMHAVAIYNVSEGLITKVWFLKEG